MILVIGGKASGKTTFVTKTLGYNKTDISDDIHDNSAVLDNVDKLLLLYNVEDLVKILLKKEVIICNEVGYGIVPLNRDERALRENIGRLCAIMSESADAVIRMVCGIPIYVKG